MGYIRKWLPCILILLLLLVSLAGGATYAKYVRDYPIKNNSIQISANLGDISIDLESRSYLLIPGHDFPLEHTISVTNKSEIEAYVFVEVSGAQITGADGSKIDFVQDAQGDWIKLNIADRHIFVYKETLTADASNIMLDIYAIVPQTIKGTTVTDLTLTAYLGQCIPGQTPEQVFAQLFMTPASP